MTLDGSDDAISHFNPRFAIAPGAAVGTEAPSREFDAVLRGQLLPRQALPGARVSLAQVDVGDYREPGDGGQCGGRLHCPRKIATHDRVRFQVTKQFRGASGLLDSDRVQRDVELTLESALGIPFGAPMSPEDDPSSAQFCSPASADCSTRSRFNGIVGQSFQSRSMA